jgi:hypothetical protein
MRAFEVRVEPPDTASATVDFDDASPARFRDAYRVAHRRSSDREHAAD